MKVGQYCKRGVVAVAGSDDVVDVSRLMREEHVGFLVVYEHGDEIRRPIGVLTDRDIVLGVTAKEVDPHTVTAKDVMTPRPLLATEEDELGETLQAMRMAGVRRVPVVNTPGALVGVFALDDAIELVTGLIGDITASIKCEQRQEWRSRPR